MIRPFRQAKSALGATIFMVPHESFDISSCDGWRFSGWSDMANSGARVAGAKTFQDQLLDAIWDMDKE